MPETAFILIGSNFRAEQNLCAASRALASLGTIMRVSRVVRSRPAHGAPGSDYLNAAVLLETDLSPADLRDALKSVEDRLGRRREDARRVAIDLDLCMYGGRAIDTPDLQLPPPSTLTQAYVAVPLAELAPQFVHPRCGEALAAIAERLEKSVELEVRTDIDLSAAVTRVDRAPGSRGSGPRPSS